ncbi:MAG: cyclic nucleotide-binding domain-containing protein [Deltaproteobacteria bacterium]|nr:cyclic nucleotide-binding domain-containing protein [Deltaproteobacteria bacterium]
MGPPLVPGHLTQVWSAIGGSSLQVKFWAATDDGKQRDHNEDNFLVDKNLSLFVVADGMGGHAAGEVASSLCVRRLREAIVENHDVIERFAAGEGSNRTEILHVIEHAVHAAGSAIYERAQKQPEKRGMGTTCTLLLLAGQRGFMAHVGDSRLYLMRHNQVHQLSEDHSLIKELVRRGKVKLEDIDSSPYKDYKNAVTRAVGVYESVDVDTLDFDVLPGDQFMICSDGLHYYLDTDDKIAKVLAGDDVKHVTEAFITLANDGGGHDNITSVVVRIAEDDEADARAKDVSLKIEVLKGMPLFKHLSYKEIVRLMNITKVRDHADGEIIIREHDDADEMFIILDGTVRLHKDDAFITYLKRGDHFGEMALIDSAPRSASASAEGRARLLTLHRGEFYNIIRSEDSLSTKILWSVVQVLVQRLRKTTEDLSGARLEASLPDLTDDIDFEGLLER